MIVKEAIKYGLDNVKDIEDKSLKVKMILSNLLEVKKENLIVIEDEELSEEKEELYKEAISKLNKKIPVQYIIGKQEFFGLIFKVNESVLIPRFDTEVLIEKVLDHCKAVNKEFKILDLCTGSGAIGITLAKNLPQSKVYLSDISEDALKIAKENAKSNNVDVTIIKSDMFDDIKISDFDIIVSNPPYIEKETINNLSEEVKKEPILALDGGKTGLDYYTIIAGKAKDYLKEDGILFLEIGFNQKNSVTKLLEENGFKNIICYKDYNNLDRVIKGE